MSGAADRRAAEKALDKVLNGRHQRAVDAYAALLPKLGSIADNLAAALRRDQVELMRFEYRRVEAFNRGVGAALNRIDEALEELEALADDPAFEPVDARVARHVQSLGAMKKTLSRRTQVVNGLQAKAATAIAAAEQRQEGFDLAWEKLQDRSEETRRVFDAFAARVDRLRAVDWFGAPQRLKAQSEITDQALALTRTVPAEQLTKLKGELARLDKAVASQSTSKAFAVQFGKERPVVDRHIARIESVLSYVHTTASEMFKLRNALMLSEAKAAA